MFSIVIFLFMIAIGAFVLATALAPSECDSDHTF